MQRKKLVVLLANMESHFWEHKRPEIEKTTKYLTRFTCAFLTLGTLLVFGVGINPIFMEGRFVPLMCWTPEGNPSPFYEIIYGLQGYILFAIIGGVAGFDVLYMYINFSICVQFKLLRTELENFIGANERETVLKLKRCIEHHKFLLEYAIQDFLIRQ